MRIARVTLTIVVLAALVAGCNQPQIMDSPAQNAVTPSAPGAVRPPAGADAESQGTAEANDQGHREDDHHGQEVEIDGKVDDHAKGEEQEESGHQHEHFVATGAMVENHSVPLIVETQVANNWSPEERARRVAARLNMIATTHGISADSVFMREVRGMPTVFFYHEHGPGSQGHVLATIDPATAHQFGFEDRPQILAHWWRDVVRDHILLVQGKSPRWTTRYAPPLQRLYAALQRHRKGVPNHDAFEQALSDLPSAELESLKTLYVSVPANYQPKPGKVHAARAVAQDHSSKEDEGHDDHGKADEHLETRGSKRRPQASERQGHED